MRVRGSDSPRVLCSTTKAPINDNVSSRAVSGITGYSTPATCNVLQCSARVHIAEVYRSHRLEIVVVVESVFGPFPSGGPFLKAFSPPRDLYFASILAF